VNALRAIPIRTLSIVLAVYGSSRGSWWLSREPAEWNAQFGVGLARLPFDKAWVPVDSGTLDPDLRDGSMGALAFRGSLGWTHPSGRWGIEGALEGGERLAVLEPDENRGDFASVGIGLRWDPFYAYQIAPFCGFGVVGSRVRQRVRVGGSWSLFGSEDKDPWGVLEQERRELALGWNAGMRLGWFEMNSDILWPLMSTESRTLDPAPPGRPGSFVPAPLDIGVRVGYSLRVPLRAIPGRGWRDRRDAFVRAKEPGLGPHRFALGLEVFRVPPAWTIRSDVLEGSEEWVYAERLRWDLASAAHPERGLLVDLFQGVSDGNGRSKRVGVWGSDLGVWWDPWGESTWPVRLSGTLGFWKARFATREDGVEAGDWWGMRTSIGTRLSNEWWYLGARFDVDLVQPGTEPAPDPLEVADRAGMFAVGGSMETGLQYRF